MLDVNTVDWCLSADGRYMACTFITKKLSIYRLEESGESIASEVSVPCARVSAMCFVSAKTPTLLVVVGAQCRELSLLGDVLRVFDLGVGTFEVAAIECDGAYIAAYSLGVHVFEYCGKHAWSYDVIDTCCYMELVDSVVWFYSDNNLCGAFVVDGTILRLIPVAGYDFCKIRGKEEDFLIETELKLVYRKGNNSYTLMPFPVFKDQYTRMRHVQGKGFFQYREYGVYFYPEKLDTVCSQ